MALFNYIENNNHDFRHWSLFLLCPLCQHVSLSHIICGLNFTSRSGLHPVYLFYTIQTDLIVSFLFYFLQQKLLHPMAQSPSKVLRRTRRLIRRKREVKMSGNKWVPETRLLSLVKPTLSAHLSRTFLVDTSGKLVN